jgi:hypothetical protein
MKDFFTQISLDIHKIEREFTETNYFKGDKFPFKSNTLTIAYNHIREARMFSRDCLRILGVEEDYINAYQGILQNQEAKTQNKG